ncbi:histidine kinase [Clostridium sp. PL3]|uniref:Histidine kinase n=1 Tax=Clostridium thailandense TaxID=2794346 RepID=A0A949TZ69_9CLOT|nr:histidine kinase [Clostridium thailandense]MBV7274501.1 histidine kinase [Clostridium thailandense]
MNRHDSDYFHVNKLLDRMKLIDASEEIYPSVEELLRLEMAFVQSQIKPHFLYNTINTISAFSIDNPKMTRDLLVKFSQYLRGCFDLRNRDKLVTFHKELELVETYLFIEKARFGERLKVIYDIEDKIDCMLPPLIIQPLVENSVQHGLEPMKKGGVIKVSAHSEENFVIITVEDDGIGISDEVYGKLFEDKESEGSSLKKINQRLIYLYNIGLAIERGIERGTKVKICIPKKFI